MHEPVTRNEPHDEVARQTKNEANAQDCREEPDRCVTDDSWTHLNPPKRTGVQLRALEKAFPRGRIERFCIEKRGELTGRGDRRARNGSFDAGRPALAPLLQWVVGRCSRCRLAAAHADVAIRLRRRS
jgi:hypothetical protein